VILSLVAFLPECVCVCGWVSDCVSLVALLPECVLCVCVCGG